MMNNASGRKAESRRFLIALAASLLLHMAVLWKFGMLPPGLPGTHSGPLQVRLAAPATKYQASVAEQEPAVPEGMPAPQEVKLAAEDSSRINAPVVSKTAPEAIPAAPASGILPPTSAKETPAQVVGLPRVGQAGATRRVELEFEIYSGVERHLVGKGRHVYSSRDDQSYGISVKQIAVAPESDSQRPWELLVSGLAGRQGLSPALFQVQGSLARRLAALKADSAGASSPSVEMPIGRMPEGVLDRQSLLYQFMVAPPSNDGGKLWLTDGAAGTLYTYRVAGYESLAVSSMGNVQTLKLVFSTAASAEIIELWLIPDKRYLPAKMRHKDRFGVVTEQVVVSLDLN